MTKSSFFTLHIVAHHWLMTPLLTPQLLFLQIPGVYNYFACIVVRFWQDPMLLRDYDSFFICIFLCLFNISQFSPINSLDAMSKRTQEDAGEERVTAMQRRNPNVLASTASESPVKTKSEESTYLWARWMSSKQEQGDLCWALAHQTTQNGTSTTSGLLKCGNLVKCRTQVRRDPYMTSLSSMMIWTLTPSQNRTFLQVTIILEQGECSIAQDAGPFFKRCNARHRQTFYNLENVYVFNIGSISTHGI